MILFQKYTAAKYRNVLRPSNHFVVVTELSDEQTPVFLVCKEVNFDPGPYWAYNYITTKRGAIDKCETSTLIDKTRYVLEVLVLQRNIDSK